MDPREKIQRWLETQEVGCFATKCDMDDDGEGSHATLHSSANCELRFDSVRNSQSIDDPTLPTPSRAVAFHIGLALQDYSLLSEAETLPWAPLIDISTASHGGKVSIRILRSNCCSDEESP